MIAILLCLLRFLLWPRICSMLLNVPRVFEKIACSACWIERSVKVSEVKLVDSVVQIFRMLTDFLPAYALDT